MGSVRALSARVARLERVQGLLSPIEAAFGSFAAFEAHCVQEQAAGRLDLHDFSVVIMCLREWENDGTWAA
jgi:hypothetical protein